MTAYLVYVSQNFSGSQSGVETEEEALVGPGAVVLERGDGAIWMERRQKKSRTT